MENQLTPQGAALLRQARDQILAHPDQFDMRNWDCGTTACVGGWMCRIAGIAGEYQDRALSVCCGFGVEQIRASGLMVQAHPMYPLFYRWPVGTTRSALAAAGRINAFLWSYGYPPEAVIAPVEAEAALVTVEGRV